jgi:hypothetical protein
MPPNGYDRYVRLDRLDGYDRLDRLVHLERLDGYDRLDR